MKNSSYRCLLFGGVLAGLAGLPAQDEPDAPALQLATRDVFVPQEVDEFAFVDDATWVVAASGRPQPIALAPASVTVLEGRDVMNSPAITLPDLLRYQAGVDVFQIRHGQFEVGLRGFSNVNTARTLALYDGREFRIEQVGIHHWVGRMHQSDLHRIEIVRGPASVTYGANAFGGVISISSTPTDQAPPLRVFQQLGTDGLLESDATVGLRLGRGDSWWSASHLKISAGLSRRDDLPGHEGMPFGPGHPRIDRSFDDDLEAERASGTWLVPLTEGVKLEIGGSLFNAPTWDLTHDYVAGVQEYDVEVVDAHISLRTPYGKLSHSRTWTDGFLSNQKIVYDTNQEPDFWYFQAGFDDVWDKTRLEITREIGPHVLIAGAEYEHVESRSNLWSATGRPLDKSTWREVSWSNIAAFIEDQWLFHEAWAVTGGLRVDHHSEVDTNVSPRLALNYQPEPDQFLRASLSSGYRLPSSIEQYLEKRFFAASPKLEAETILSADLGWSKDWTDTGLHSDLTVFYSRADDLIAFEPIDEAQMSRNWDEWMNGLLADIGAGRAPDLGVGPGNFFEYRNSDNPLHSYGIEVGLHWRPPAYEQLDVWSNLTWTHSRYEEDVVLSSDGFTTSGPPALGGGGVRFRFDENLGRDIGTPPEFKLAAGGLYHQGNYFIGAAIRYVDSRRIWSIAYSNFNNDMLRIQEIDSYLTADLSCGLWWGADRERADGYLKLSVMNLFDVGHYEAHQVGSSILIDGLDNSYSSEVPLSLAGTLSARF